MKTYQSDVIIAGGGIAGLVTAYELLKKGKNVIIFDKDVEDNLGGLAKEAAGGIHMIDTPEQRSVGIKDSPELAFQDWLNIAKFDEDDEWPRKWAQFYCNNSLEYIYDYFKEIQAGFIPAPTWAERGLYRSGNSLPRFHVTWGTGFELVNKTVAAINKLPQRSNLQIYFEHEVNDILQGDGKALMTGKNMLTDEAFQATGEQVIIASGGIGGGDLSYLKEHWPGKGRKAPDNMLNGAHKFGDGLLHRKIEERGGVLTHLENNWPYALGVHHPEKRKPFDGISTMPGISSLWFNALGERIGPLPLMVGADNIWLVDRILEQPGQYTWVIMNWKIATKEFIVSLSRYFTAIRNMDIELLKYNAQNGDEYRINLLLKDSPEDVFLADNIDDLIEKMQERSLYGFKINGDKLKEEIKAYDDQIDRGPFFYNDEQLARKANNMKYQPLGLVTIADFKKILDPEAGPLLAVRGFVISRKSLGGIQTDMECRVLKKDGKPFGNIYAVGEAAGYGGGGIHGKGAPEGAFLGGCILTARVCGRSVQ